jgi:hypothetical protein
MAEFCSFAWCHDVLQIEVGRPVARRPPRRSRRAELPHRAPRMDAQPVRRRSLVLVFVSDHAVRGDGCNAGVGRVSTTRGGGRFHLSRHTSFPPGSPESGNANPPSEMGDARTRFSDELWTHSQIGTLHHPFQNPPNRESTIMVYPSFFPLHNKQACHTPSNGRQDSFHRILKKQFSSSRREPPAACS